eukprot:Phypoly_transcript_21269.p1 GENE.Phypoly_transcript_21269~~Phypoly_transcript_21269.p1  ORF type:complete len:200 (+),score=19.18 Phypoly_transcript_21269:2-601(+)
MRDARCATPVQQPAHNVLQLKHTQHKSRCNTQHIVPGWQINPQIEVVSSNHLRATNLQHTTPTRQASMQTYQGGCHCGKVRYEVTAPKDFEIVKCNCSICNKKGFLHLIVPKSQFNLLQGKEFISTYTFNTGVAKHHFCSACGISSYYIPRSNPDGVDVNVRCLDSFDPNREYMVQKFDGQNWEKNAASLAHLSHEHPE